MIMDEVQEAVRFAVEALKPRHILVVAPNEIMAADVAFAMGEAAPGRAVWRGGKYPYEAMRGTDRVTVLSGANPTAVCGYSPTDVVHPWPLPAETMNELAVLAVLGARFWPPLPE